MPAPLFAGMIAIRLFRNREGVLQTRPPSGSGLRRVYSSVVAAWRASFVSAGRLFSGGPAAGGDFSVELFFLLLRKTFSPNSLSFSPLMPYLIRTPPRMRLARS